MTLTPNRQDAFRRPADANPPLGSGRRAAKEFAWGNWLLAAVAATAATGYVFFLFLPNQKAIESLRRDFAVKQGVVQSGTDLSVALAELRRKLATVHAHNAAWEQNHPDRGELAALYGQMTALGKSASVTITRFDPQPFVPHESVSTVPLDLEFCGSFTEVFTFLRDLESLPQQVSIRSLKIERLGGSAKDVGCKISVDVFSDNPKDSDQEGRSR